MRKIISIISCIMAVIISCSYAYAEDKYKLTDGYYKLIYMLPNGKFVGSLKVDEENNDIASFGYAYKINTNSNGELTSILNTYNGNIVMTYPRWLPLGYDMNMRIDSIKNFSKLEVEKKDDAIIYYLYSGNDVLIYKYVYKFVNHNDYNKPTYVNIYSYKDSDDGNLENTISFEYEGNNVIKTKSKNSVIEYEYLDLAIPSKEIYYNDDGSVYNIVGYKYDKQLRPVEITSSEETYNSKAMNHHNVKYILEYSGPKTVKKYEYYEAMPYEISFFNENNEAINLPMYLPIHDKDQTGKFIHKYKIHHSLNEIHIKGYDKNNNQVPVYYNYDINKIYIKYFGLNNYGNVVEEKELDINYQPIGSWAIRKTTFDKNGKYVKYDVFDQYGNLIL